MRFWLSLILGGAAEGTPEREEVDKMLAFPERYTWPNQEAMERALLNHCDDRPPNRATRRARRRKKRRKTR
jgi:hypothetical protein